MREEFKVLHLNKAGNEAVDLTAEAFNELVTKLDSVIPPGRHRSILLTKLEEASLWASQAIGMVPEYREP